MNVGIRPCITAATPDRSRGDATPYVTGCDRSYQHTDYYYCSPHHIPARRGYGEGLKQLCADENEDNACYMKATKTWMHNDCHSLP